ncbi:MAG: CehA/McbA family metallohydrolase [Chloroflexota bacterium]
MNNLPFDKSGRFWRGNLHCHSTNSDGLKTPEEVCQLYREAGYHFISLTDHFLAQYNFPLTDTRVFRQDDFTTLLGAELHTDKTEFGSVWHILANGLPLDFAPTSPEESASHLAARALDAGAYVSVAHPHWYALTERDIESLGKVDAIEIFNGVAVDANDRADSWHIADVMLGRGHRYTTCATDDYHGQVFRNDFARGWVWVKSESLTPESLLSGLKSGHYYSSTGPQIHDIQIEPGKRAMIRCSPVDRILITGKGATAAHAYGHGLLEAEIDLSRFKSPYCRVTVRDAYGERAWSNPIWLD